SQLVEKQVEFDNGEEVVEFTVFIKPLSYRTAVSEITASQASKDPLAARIANSICDKSGAPVFSIEDITGESDSERG
ncbi:phage tail assembly chaperone family protein, TAC, partial [Pseudoalteromonas sp. SIMBA_148]